MIDTYRKLQKSGCSPGHFIWGLEFFSDLPICFYSWGVNLESHKNYLGVLAWRCTVNFLTSIWKSWPLMVFLAYFSFLPFYWFFMFIFPNFLWISAYDKAFVLVIFGKSFYVYLLWKTQQDSRFNCQRGSKNVHTLIFKLLWTERYGDFYLFFCICVRVCRFLHGPTTKQKS